MKEGVIKRLTNRYTILIANILLSVTVGLLLYAALLLYVKINPIETFYQFFDFIDIGIKVIGTLIALHVIIVSIGLIRSIRNRKREHIYGYSFAILYCLSFFLLYWLDK